MTGAKQEDWLLRGLRSSDARWNVLAQQVMMSRVNFAPTSPVPLYNMDAWDGYAAARNRILGYVRDHTVPNVVVLTGDIHSSWAADLRANFDAAGSPSSRFVPAEPSSLCIAAIAQMPPLGIRSSSARRAIQELMLERSRRYCEAARTRLQGHWADLTVHVTDGNPHEGLLRAAEEWNADLVVFGRSATGDSSPLLGSVARLGARYLNCSVLLVDREPASIREIVLGMDGSASAREAVRLLSLFPFGPTPRVLALGIVNTSWRRAIELDELPPAVRPRCTRSKRSMRKVARAALARTATALADRATVESEVATGSPAQVLLDAARQRSADLLVLGHQGVEPVRRLALGSVAEQLLTAATCSLLIGRK